MIDNRIFSKVLVIGGAGFIGSNLSNTLYKSQCDVTVLDNLSSGNSDNLHANITFVNGDALNINEIFNDENFSHVFHLGEYSRVEQSFHEFNSVIDNNLVSFPKVLRYCSSRNAKLIYSASSTILSETEYRDISLSPYTLTKNINAALLRNYASWCDLDYVILYFYNVYGPGEITQGKYSTVVGKFLELLKKGEKKLPVTAPGTQRRNFTHIEDLIEGILLAGAYGKGDDYCIGAEEDLSILELVELIGGTPEIVPSPRGNRSHGVMNLDKIKSLGWVSKRDIYSYVKNYF